MSDRMAEEAGAAFGVLLVVGLIVTIWLLSKMVEMVVRVWMIDPHNRVLRWATGIAVGMLLLCGLTGGQLAPINALAGLAVGALLLVCKILDVYYDTLLQREITKETVIHDVLHEPWFAAA